MRSCRSSRSGLRRQSVRLLRRRDTFATASSYHHSPCSQRGWVSDRATAIRPSPRWIAHGSSDDGLRPDDVALVHLRRTSLPRRCARPRTSVLQVVTCRDVAIIADGCRGDRHAHAGAPGRGRATPVRLLDASGTAEILARATLQPFYGIEPTAWVRSDDAPERPGPRSSSSKARRRCASRKPDSARISSAPGSSSPPNRSSVTSSSLPASFSCTATAGRRIPRSCATRGWTRGANGVPPLAEREGVGKDRASAFWAAQRLSLEPRTIGRRLLDLWRGSPGSVRLTPVRT